MRLILLGAPGAGKGTQCQKLVDHLRVPHLSTGEMLRSAVRAGTSEGVQAATYIAAVAVARGDVVVRGARAEHMEMLLNRFADMGVAVTPVEGGLRVVSTARLTSIDFSTLPYPGIATDYKPLLVGMLAVADGVGVATENLYPGRFRYVEELVKLGANVRIEGHHAIVRGVDFLRGAAVSAPDIRAGAALVVAGLVAEGETVIDNIQHIDRGYDDLVGRLAALGANVTRR